MRDVSLNRPPRPPAGAITDRVRRAILLAAERLGAPAHALLALHGQAEHIGSSVDLLADVEERYNVAPHSLSDQVEACLQGVEAKLRAAVSPLKARQVDAECVLYVLPDTEFLTVLEHAVDVGLREGRLTAGVIAELLKAAEGALQAHGCPFRRSPNDWRRFEWVGDPKQHELAVQPALLVLGDPRLAGSRAEFEEALRKRRLGTPKDLEDAVDEAAKSVESILKVLHDERGVTPPRSQQVTPLFNSLVAAKEIPSYVDKLIAAASGPRNNMASHGQGGMVREVREELAEASIAAAAVAITFLAHYLP